MPSSKRKAAHASAHPRKVRRLSDDDSDSSSSSSTRSPQKPDLPSMKTIQASEEDDSDDETSTPIVLDDLPERIRISSKKIAAPKIIKETPMPPATTDFAELGISPTLVRALKTMSIRKPTPVQAACIPSLLSGEVTGTLLLNTLLNHHRSRLHWKRQNWIWKDHRFCDPNIATTGLRPIRNICSGPNAYTVCFRSVIQGIPNQFHIPF